MGVLEGNRRILLPVAIFIGLHFFSALSGFAQDSLFSWKPFSTRASLMPAVPVFESNMGKQTVPSKDVMNSDFELLNLRDREDVGKEPEGQWDIYDWGGVSLSLSTLRNKIIKRDISGPMMNEKNRFETIQSLASNFSELPSREGFQHIGEIFEPELKVGIKF